ncbi:cytochrome d ubiquinol oxidase subunit II [Jiella pacifica]|uniref:cytochrome d ubiquinol oxidase subunit II n=1 Tax=Jiella pacifica TaxID=2696469 RepID=UPI0028B09E79|nr:cytochrome d ubiquinol oxidase subunit II [Jiella pacifica]
MDDRSGLPGLAMIAMHGAAWLAFKAEGPVADRAAIFGARLGVATAVLFGFGGILVALGLFGGYAVVGTQAAAGPSNPLFKEVVVAPEAWLANYAAHPLLIVAPLLGIAGPLLAALGFATRRDGPTFFASALGVVGIIATVGVSMFPMILPSSTNPAQSLTVFDASSSESTLRTMLIATAIFLPIVLAYTSWVYKVLWGKVREEDVNASGSAAY